MKQGKPSLIEQSHNAWLAYIKAKKSGDKKKAAQMLELHQWIGNEIRKGKE